MKGIPSKGKLLTAMSTFWFDYLKDIIGNHFVTADMDKMPASVQKYRDQLAGRSMLVKKLKIVPCEAIVRGYITGSGWSEYKKKGTICDIVLKTGLVESDKLDKPLFTPSTKAEASEYALSKGIIIADTKFEFGLDENGTLVLADEVLTPDSSRFWPADQYAPGKTQPSYDKQYLRDFLTSVNFDKSTGIELPEDVIKHTVAKYGEACTILTGKNIQW
ncbi:Bifunctional purine biosynthetic protein ade1 [Blyttiomyces sp. JEL0837]|nr:Bifunctional purine biosynthetic protein ade1 [Blyttiomyces sp. JEL0837]